MTVDRDHQLFDTQMAKCRLILTESRDQDPEGLPEHGANRTRIKSPKSRGTSMGLYETLTYELNAGKGSSER